MESLSHCRVEGLTLDILNEHVAGVPLDRLLHLRLDGQQEVVLWQGGNDVEVVVGYQLCRPILGR